MSLDASWRDLVAEIRTTADTDELFARRVAAACAAIADQAPDGGGGAAIRTIFEVN